MNNEPNAVPDSLQAFTNCEEWGKGGSFVYDPLTGLRTRVVSVDEPSAEPSAPVIAAQVAEPVLLIEQSTAVEAASSKKEKARA